MESRISDLFKVSKKSRKQMKALEALIEMDKKELDKALGDMKKVMIELEKNTWKLAKLSRESVLSYDRAGRIKLVPKEKKKAVLYF